MTYTILGLTALAALGILTAVDAAPAAPADKPVVVLDTTAGPITVELDRDKAPVTVDNFLKYVDSGFYDGTIFHRVIPGFMIQCGGMEPDLSDRRKGINPPIQNEGTNGLLNRRGTLAMARTGDPDSATAQFFINLNDNDFLNARPAKAGYAVFGRVTEGMAAVDEIAKANTVTKGMHENVPTKTILIKSARRKSS